MSKIIWDNIGERFFETGVSEAVLYPVGVGGAYGTGVAWNGVTAVSEAPSGAEATPVYADNIKYLNLVGAEEFGATIEAYTYPDEFAQCDGSAEIAKGVTIGQQNRKPFGLSYKTLIGNDVDGTDHGYKINLIYGALAAPSEKGYSTVNGDPEAMTMSWEVTTTPVLVPGYKPTAKLTVDSRTVDPEKLKAFEAIIHGTDANPTAEPPVEASEPRLPLPAEIIELVGAIAQG